MENDDRGINETRGYGCEITAYRYLIALSPSDLIENLLHEVPPPGRKPGSSEAEEAHGRDEESTALLNHAGESQDEQDDPLAAYVGLNALEIASIAEAKKFLSQRTVQKVVDDIWNGDIIFWESLSVHSKKKAKVYNKKRADPYCRLRVPKYQKSFEAIFFAVFLILFYITLAEPDPGKFTIAEVFLYIWICAFAYDEFGEYQDAGASLYATDFWSLWDLGIILIGFAYMISRVVGLAKGNAQIDDVSFDILSLEALFLLPRVCALLSLVPFFGTLVGDGSCGCYQG